MENGYMPPGWPEDIEGAFVDYVSDTDSGYSSEESNAD